MFHRENKFTFFFLITKIIFNVERVIENKTIFHLKFYCEKIISAERKLIIFLLNDVSAMKTISTKKIEKDIYKHIFLLFALYQNLCEFPR